MTQYSFEGAAVMVKSPLQTESALAAAAIAVGQLVIPDGTDPTKYNVAGANALNVRGVATEARASGDARPVTAISRGVVRVITNNSAILVDSPLKAGASGKVALFVTGTDTEDRRIGKARQANGSVDATVIIAELDCAQGGA
jgi:hypothetical protein